MEIGVMKEEDAQNDEEERKEDSFLCFTCVCVCEGYHIINHSENLSLFLTKEAV